MAGEYCPSCKPAPGKMIRVDKLEAGAKCVDCGREVIGNSCTLSIGQTLEQRVVEINVTASDPAYTPIEHEVLTLINDLYKALSEKQPDTSLSDPVAMAYSFHYEYERLAPMFGYKTREDTRVFDSESPNGKLMVAVMKKLMGNMGTFQAEAIRLWKLLDDISTAGDMFKPEITPYFRYISKKEGERNGLITSDGYALFAHGKVIDGEPAKAVAVAGLSKPQGGTT